MLFPFPNSYWFDFKRRMRQIFSIQLLQHPSVAEAVRVSVGNRVGIWTEEKGKSEQDRRERSEHQLGVELV